MMKILQHCDHNSYSLVAKSWNCAYRYSRAVCVLGGSDTHHSKVFQRFPNIRRILCSYPNLEQIHKILANSHLPSIPIQLAEIGEFSKVSLSRKLLDSKDSLRPLMEVRADGMALLRVDQAIREYRAVALAAVRQNGLAIQYVSPDIEDYREIALAAVEESGLALMHIPRDVEGYREIALTAFCIKETPCALTDQQIEEMRQCLTLPSSRVSKLYFASSPKKPSLHP